jgi:hypothetical protein
MDKDLCLFETTSHNVGQDHRSNTPLGLPKSGEGRKDENFFTFKSEFSQNLIPLSRGRLYNDAAFGFAFPTQFRHRHPGLGQHTARDSMRLAAAFAPWKPKGKRGLRRGITGYLGTLIMADAFQDREKAFEAKFKHDQELEFRARARRNKLLGLWAAETMGMAGGGAVAYARQVVAVDLEEHGDADVIKKVLADLANHDVEMTEGRLQIKLGKMMDIARQQIMTESSQ